MNIDLNLLEYFITFVETGSLLKASEKLYISQPSLSKGMQKLENDLGIKLFDRKKNKLALNENGEKIIPYIKDILEMNNRLIEKCNDIKNNEESLNIGLIAPGPMLKYSNLFFNLTSKVKITCKMEKEDELIKGLINNTYDVIFLNAPYKDANYISQKMFNEQLFLLIPQKHFLSKYKDNLTWKDIDGQSFLLYNYIGSWEDIVIKYLPESRFLKSYSQDDLKEIVENSSLPSFVTNLSYENKKIEGRVVIPIIDEKSNLDFYLICKNNNKRILELFK